MKEKGKVAKIVFGVVCVIIVAVCIIIQIVMKNETRELEKEGEKFSTLEVQTTSGKKIETEYVHVEDNKFFIKIPTNFIQLDHDTIMNKYSGDIPDIVFSNEETTMNVAISITENNMKDDQIKTYQSTMKNILKNSSEIVGENYYKVNKHNIGQLKLVTDTADTKIYNNMICFSYNDKLVIITFNCTEDLREEWQNVGDFIIDSLFFSE